MSGYKTLIQAKDLAALLHENPSAVLVCDCSFDLADHGAGRRAYEAGHIPGAAYLQLEEDLSGPKTGRNGRHPLPERATLALRLASLGAAAETQIVAYDAGDGMFAARLWWLVRWLGHRKVAVLDGGLKAWRAAGQEVETGAAAPHTAGTFEAGPSLVSTLDYAAVAEISGTGGKLIVDARAPDRFRGENETLDPIGGHIPGAKNRFFRQNLTPEGRFKPADVLRQEFAAVLGATPASESVMQCGSGVTACHNLLALEIAGLSGAALYPGSWSEWSAQPGAKVAQGDA